MQLLKKFMATALMLVSAVSYAQYSHTGNFTVDGNVGVGTSTPASKFHVEGAGITIPFRFRNTNSTHQWLFSAANTANGDRFDIASTVSGVQLGINPNTGRVGLGTALPADKLHLRGTDTALGIRFDNLSSSIDWQILARDTANGDRLDIMARTFPVAMTIKADGKIGINNTNPTKILDVGGELGVDVLEIYGGSDLSEKFDVLAHETQQPEPGILVSIDPKSAGGLTVSSKAYDKRIAGVISGAGGLNTGMMMGQQGSRAFGAHPVALTGRVYCYADASFGAIEPGDMLTSSDHPGYAMKVNDFAMAQGAIIGKAMTSLSDGEKGLVLVLISLQ